MTSRRSRSGLIESPVAFATRNSDLSDEERTDMSSTQTFQTTTTGIGSNGGTVAHIFERLGLAMMGASGGLFVAVNMSRIDVELLASPLVALGFVIYGAIGFYLGIDFPREVPQLTQTNATDAGMKIRLIEQLSAAGTLCAALAAFASVCGIVIDADSQSLAFLVGCGWLVGATMQIVAGTRARRLSAASPTPRHAPSIGARETT
jgi:hypothetical protein